MDSISHHIASFVQQSWKWIVGGGLVLFLGLFWKPIMEMLKSLADIREAWHKAGTAAAQHRIAVAETPHAEWEASVKDMMRRFRRHYNEAEAKYPGKNIVPIIKPSPEDDLEVFNEAMRRIKIENAKVHGGRLLA